MCGIVGVCGKAPVIDRTMLAAMTDAMRHRGPDAAGVWCSESGEVALGHRRLAIIDLSAAAEQPMVDASGRLRIIFNGEIYNYRELRDELRRLGRCFRTASDTEVLLEAYREWGTDCVRRLNGMFAFAITDADARRVFLARDRAGEKPLFYHHRPGRFSFASELKALMADPAFPRHLDVEALEYYLAFGYVPGERAILKDVRKLPQGHCMVYELDGDRVTTWPYWELPESVVLMSTSPEEQTDRLDALLEDAVRRQLAADVPVGILLSGGLDSSLVTAMAARVSSAPVKTFTVSFPGHGMFDESPHARIVADHFGTDHLELPLEPATVDILPLLARQYDEPMADSSMVPTFLVSRLIREHATVALGGDGGDELFGGYWSHSWILSQERVRGVVPRPARRLVGAIAERSIPVGFKGREFLLGYTSDLGTTIGNLGIFFDEGARRALLAPLGVPRGHVPRAPESYRISRSEPSRSALQRITCADFRTYLVDDILVKVDRASMLASLEVRAPWLDYRIIEMAFGALPDSLRAAGSARKILPRRLAARLLPRSLDLTRKRGFSLPLRSWAKGVWGEFFETVLNEADTTIFDRRPIRELISRQRLGLNNTHRLFGLTMFELWRREYGITLA